MTKFKTKITDLKAVKIKVIKAKINIKKIPGKILKCWMLPETRLFVAKFISVFTISGN